jgi:SMC interacting uncharacterized protein involved in chromosome segregation
MRYRTLALCTVLLSMPCLTGCESTRIELADHFGYAKRDQLVDNVQAARDGQEAAKEQFSSALEEFLAVTDADVGELDEAYASLRKQLERSEDRAEMVRDRIRSVERVALSLFREWEKELDQYQSDALRDTSTRQLEATRSRYAQLLASMKQAESKMEPVLAAFRDQVLFLKHNLNARAIAALSETASGIENDVAALIKDLEASITEANAFIDQLTAESG